MSAGYRSLRNGHDVGTACRAGPPSIGKALRRSPRLRAIPRRRPSPAASQVCTATAHRPTGGSRHLRASPGHPSPAARYRPHNPPVGPPTTRRDRAPRRPHARRSGPRSGPPWEPCELLFSRSTPSPTNPPVTRGYAHLAHLLSHLAHTLPFRDQPSGTVCAPTRSRPGPRGRCWRRADLVATGTSASN
jgi:hypothetical protein